MATQSAIQSYAQERLGLQDYQDLQNFVAEDFGLLQQKLINADSCVVKGLEVSHLTPPSLNIRIAVPGSVLINGANDGTMWVAPDDADDIDITVLDEATTYVWLTLEEITTENAVRIFWDPTANDGEGEEFEQAVDTVKTYEVTEHTSTTGFPSGDNTVIHVCVVTATGGTITSLIDHRKLLFRLGRGGDTIDVDYDYPYSDGQDEPDPDLKVDSDAFVAGDKQLETFKDWMDAVMSALKAIKGTTYWTDDPPSTLSIEPIAMTGGGTFAWNSGTGALTFSANITFLIPGTAFTNSITAGTITLSADNQIAYVDIDKTSSATLTPTVVASGSYAPATNRLIIARRISSVAYVGIE